MRKFLFLFALVLSLPILSGASLPSPQGYVNDFAGILTTSERAELENLSQTIEAKSGIQLAIVTVKDIDDASIEEYANALFTKWKIGKKGQDNGVLFVTAVDNRKVRIEVGYGLEGVLNDGKVGALLDESVLPFFKAGQMGDGIRNGTYALASTLSVAYGFSLDSPAPVRKKKQQDNSVETVVGALVTLFILGLLFRSRSGALPWIILGALSSGGSRGGDFGGFGGSGFGGFGGGFSGGGGASRGW